MSDESTPRRRRRQAVPGAQEAPLQKKDKAEQPVRIVVTNEENTPAWMVTDTSGAASRRAKKSDGAPRVAAQREKTESPEPVGEPTEAPKPRQAAPVAVPQKKRAAETGAKPKKKTKKKTSKKKARKIRRTVTMLIAAAAVVVVIAAAAITANRVLDVKQTLDQGDGVFYPNIFVNDIPLEGKTLDQAAQDVTAQVTSRMSTWKITLRTQDGRTWDITSRDLNMQYDIADQLD